MSTNENHPLLFPSPHHANVITPLSLFGTFILDYIIGLPQFSHYDTILIVVNHDLTKRGVFILCKLTDTAEETAGHLITHVFKFFGLPDQIINNRGPHFITKVIRAMA